MPLGARRRCVVSNDYYEAPTGSKKHNSIRRACPVREAAGEKLAKALIFYCSVPSDVASQMNKWIATPTMEPAPHDVIYISSPGERRVLTRNVMDPTCIHLSRGQRCTDWYILGQYRINTTLVAEAFV